MRKIYFIRHGRPDFADQGKWCIGTTDIPLGNEGHLQSCLLSFELKKYEIKKVFCSSLIRSVETARYLEPNPTVWSGLEEPYAGEWDGLSFTEIKVRWPKLYEARGENPQIQPPGAEKTEITIERFMKAVDEILASTTGDIAIVAHKTVIQLFLHRIAKREMVGLPYASFTIVEYEEKTKEFLLKEVGKQAQPVLTEELCQSLLKSVKVPENVKAHCKAVADEAKKITQELSNSGVFLDENKIVCGAWLHDIARTYNQHDILGAQWIRNLGYPEIADLILQHNNLSWEDKINEAAVIYLADKCIKGEQIISIEERFQKSARKCTDNEAIKMHKQRYDTAVEVKNKINSICGKEN